MTPSKQTFPWWWSLLIIQYCDGFLKGLMRGLKPNTILDNYVEPCMNSDNVDDDEKVKMAAKLLSLPRDEEELHFGLPTFPDVDENTKLADLITSKSWLFFTILNIPADWLVLPPAQWKENQDYIEVEQFVNKPKGLKVAKEDQMADNA